MAEIGILNFKTLQQSIVLGLLIIFREKIIKRIKKKEFFNIILNIYFFLQYLFFLCHNIMIFSNIWYF